MARTVIVTGASKGIGFETAKVFAAQGDTVVIFDIDQENGEKAAAAETAQGHKVFFQQVNIVKSEEVKKAVSAVVNAHGPVEVLVNCAGILDLHSFEETTEEVWDRVMGINLKGAFLVSQAVLPYMSEKKKGSIINIASSAGRTGGVKTGVTYSVSKAGVIGLTRTLARMAAPDKITVNCIAPGTTNTDMAKLFTDADIEAIINQVPLRGLVEPSDIGQAVYFFASEPARMITGIVMDINGGIYMG